MELVFGQTIRWTDFSGNVTAVTSGGHDTRKAALTEALAMAREMGWTPPKWWQFWRWNDTRVPREE